MLVTSDLEISVQSCFQLPLLLSPSVTFWLWFISLPPSLGGVSLSPKDGDVEIVPSLAGNQREI